MWKEWIISVSLICALIGEGLAQEPTVAARREPRDSAFVVAWQMTHRPCEHYTIRYKLGNVTRGHRVDRRFTGEVEGGMCVTYAFPGVQFYEGDTTVTMIDRFGQVIGSWEMEKVR